MPESSHRLLSNLARIVHLYLPINFRRPIVLKIPWKKKVSSRWYGAVRGFDTSENRTTSINSPTSSIRFTLHIAPRTSGSFSRGSTRLLINSRSCISSSAAHRKYSPVAFSRTNLKLNRRPSIFFLPIILNPAILCDKFPDNCFGFRSQVNNYQKQ